MGLLLKLNSACEKLIIIIIIITSISNALNKFHKGACCDMNTMAYTHLSVKTKTISASAGSRSAAGRAFQDTGPEVFKKIDVQG